MSLYKASVLITIYVFAGTGLAAGQADNKGEASDAYMEKFSYIMGRDVITALNKLTRDMDLEAFKKGVEDRYKGIPSPMSKSEMLEIKKEVTERLKKQRGEKIELIARKNLKEGERFLEKNRIKEGVITTKSGLQYKVVKEGNGQFPTLSDTVVVHYRGFLINGLEFESSYRRGRPVTVKVMDVLSGWVEALPKMREGSVYKLFLPAALAYGKRFAGARGKVAPNSVTVFEVSLIKIVPKQGDATGATRQ